MISSTLFFAEKFGPSPPQGLAKKWNQSRRHLDSDKHVLNFENVSGTQNGRWLKNIEQCSIDFIFCLYPGGGAPVR